MSTYQQLLDDAKKKDDAVFLWRAVQAASVEELRTFSSKFTGCFRSLDETQRDVFRSLVAIHGGKLDGHKRSITVAITRA